MFPTRPSKAWPRSSRANPRGLLLARDELAGWIGSTGADSSHWLSMHNDEPMSFDRKTGKRQTIYIPRACVSVCGGIQPDILRRALGAKHLESGLAARLLLTYPPRKPKQWTDAEIAPDVEMAVTGLLDRLYALQGTGDSDGREEPTLVGLTVGAREKFRGFVDSHGKEHNRLTGALASAWSKLEEYAARLALVIHLARAAADDRTLANPDEVDTESMAAGIALVQWFKGEARRRLRHAGRDE